MPCSIINPIQIITGIHFPCDMVIAVTLYDEENERERKKQQSLVYSNLKPREWRIIYTLYPILFNDNKKQFQLF